MIDKRVRRAWRAIERSLPKRRLPRGDPTPDHPVRLGYKTAWFAVPAMEPAVIAGKLSCEEARPANWRSGFDLSRHVSAGYITPPVRGWSLIVSYEFLGMQEKEAGRDLTGRLSARFGRAQYFATHRVVDLQAWAKAEQGVLVRHFAWLGESGQVLANDGPQTREEKGLGFPNLSGMTLEEAAEAMVGRKTPSEEDVMRVAARWSLDPNALEPTDAGAGAGLIFRVPKRWREWLT